MKKHLINKTPTSGQEAPTHDVAKELHDGVCQTLTAVQFLARILMRKMEASKSPDLPATRELNTLLQKTREELGAVIKHLGEKAPKN